MTRRALLLEVGAQLNSVQPVSDRRLWRAAMAAGLFCAVLWCGAVLFLWLAQSYLLFRTGQSRAFTNALDAGIFDETVFQTADGLQLEGLVLEHAPAEERYWILFCLPAGASTRQGRIQTHLRHLWSFGYNVSAFDYRGFGGNGGTPSEAGLYEDATAAYRYLIDSHGVSASRIILAGRSLGGSVAVDLATRVESGGILLFSPIDSVPDRAARLFPWAPARWLSRYRFDLRSKAVTVERPVILVYGAPDRHMRISDARSLLQGFRGTKRMLETNGNHHFSGFMDLQGLRDALAEFWPPGPLQRTW